MSTPISVMLSKQNEELPVFPAGKRRLLLIRSVLGATNLMTHFYSLQVRYAMWLQTLFEAVFELSWFILEAKAEYKGWSTS